MTKHSILILALLLAFGFNNIQQANAQAPNNAQAPTQQFVIPNTNQVLALSRSSLDTATAKVGDVFQARVVESLTVGNNIIIPSGSTISGLVSKVRKPSRHYINKDGRIEISINQIQTPEGLIIPLTGRAVDGIVISPYYETLGRRVKERIPINVAASGTSIPIGEAIDDLNGGVTYAISVGAGMVGGFASGLMMPDVGRTRVQSALVRTYEATPIGTVHSLFSKGLPAEINTGEGIVLNFDRETVAKIQTQYAAQALAPAPVTTTLR